MEKKLRHLYLLQQIDNRLDELEELKGDLPGEVRALEATYAELTAQKSATEEAMRAAFMQRDTADSDIIGLKEKLELYKKQQYAVRTNREYDALTKEMDSATETISRLEKEMEGFETRATVSRSSIEGLAAQMESTAAELTERRAALAEVSKATEEQELQFNHKREKVLVHIAKPDLAIYLRIRKARKGKAVVPVMRNACGGCFARVPPQKILELRRNDRIFTCEHCGRILVSDEIVELVAKEQ